VKRIGAAARAMQNFGLNDLRLVSPRDGWPNERAIQMSAGAFDVMSPVKVFETFKESIADLHYVFATTARIRDMNKPVFTPNEAAAESQKRNDQNIGIVFGAERTGLLSDDLSLCQSIISVPTNPDFSSLNLGQSVLLMAYELSKVTTPPESASEQSFPASQSDVHHYLERLIQDLEDRHFFRDEGLKPTMIRNIQNIFTRADITDQELRTLQGTLSALRGNKKKP